jgi:hypothetical protein
MEFENIIRTTDSIGVRESVYSALPLPEGLAYQYTEVHSDGVRAIRVRVDHCIDRDDSAITVWFARVDDVDFLNAIPWTELHRLDFPPSQWHAETVSHTHAAAPNTVVSLVEDAVRAALHALVWDL